MKKSRLLNCQRVGAVRLRAASIGSSGREAPQVVESVAVDLPEAQEPVAPARRGSDHDCGRENRPPGRKQDPMHRPEVMPDEGDRGAPSGGRQSSASSAAPSRRCSSSMLATSVSASTGSGTQGSRPAGRTQRAPSARTCAPPRGTATDRCDARPASAGRGSRLEACLPPARRRTPRRPRRPSRRRRP